MAALVPVPASVPRHEQRAAYGGGIIASAVTVPALTVDGNAAAVVQHVQCPVPQPPAQAAASPGS
jgi:hypothetical protein